MHICTQNKRPPTGTIKHELCVCVYVRGLWFVLGENVIVCHKSPWTHLLPFVPNWHICIADTYITELDLHHSSFLVILPLFAPHVPNKYTHNASDNSLCPFQLFSHVSLLPSKKYYCPNFALFFLLFHFKAFLLLRYVLWSPFLLQYFN